MKKLETDNANSSDWQKWKRKKRRLVGIKSARGIYRVEVYDEKKKRWSFTGSYCALKQERKGGKVIRRKKVFKSVQEARYYKQGLENANSSLDRYDLEHEIEMGGGEIPPLAHQLYRPHPRVPKPPQKLITFAELVEEWKAFHFLTIEPSSLRAVSNMRESSFRSCSFLKTTLSPTSTLKRLMRWCAFG